MHDHVLDYLDIHDQSIETLQQLALQLISLMHADNYYVHDKIDHLDMKKTTAHIRYSQRRFRRKAGR